MEAQAGLQCCGLDVGPVSIPVRRRLVEHADVRESGDQFLQHVEPPRRRFRREIDRARRVASGSVERGDLRRAALDIVAPNHERDRGLELPDCAHGGAARRYDHIEL